MSSQGQAGVEACLVASRCARVDHVVRNTTDHLPEHLRHRLDGRPAYALAFIAALASDVVSLALTAATAARPIKEMNVGYNDQWMRMDGIDPRKTA